MAPIRRPTPEDRLEVIRIALGGLATGTDISDFSANLEPLHPKNNTFPGEALLDLAADALELSGATRDHPLDYTRIRQTYLPECHFRGKTEHHRSHYALRAVAMIRAGLSSDLHDEVSWWHTNDLWIWSWFALVIYVRIAAERTGQPISAVCQQIATQHGIDLGARK